MLTSAQRRALEHLRNAYCGPEGGEHELIDNRPHLQYPVGMLFPADAELPDEQSSQEVFSGGRVLEGEVEEEDAPPLAEDWRPSSVAISFVTDQPRVECVVTGGTYAAVDEGRGGWLRTPLDIPAFPLGQASPKRSFTQGGVTFEVGSRWRTYGDSFLVTIHLRLTTPSGGNDKTDVERMLFQVRLSVEPDAHGQILVYDTSRAYETDEEARELRLRFRNRQVFAVGHGMAADWEVVDGACQRIWLTPVPAFVVADVETTGFEPGTLAYQSLSLGFLATGDANPEPVLGALAGFLDDFERWISAQEERIPQFGSREDVADRIVGRSRLALERMAEGLALLKDDPGLMLAFSLGMAAMRLQMRQNSLNQGKGEIDPQWRPFQLGFILVSLASSTRSEHPDRELVDLIWFPTGGGKTEAYLGLAAIEIFRRRLEHGDAGGGTAVITRYTLRLLTSQQFQRAAALVCAMEVMRGQDPRAKGMPPFSIGLWVGNDVTPGTKASAREAVLRLWKASEPKRANAFQVESCPWCRKSLLPEGHSATRDPYGLVIVGNDVVIRCPDPECPFHHQLPLQVIDEAIYDDPPTILLATVDKFARLQFNTRAGRLLGLQTPFVQPSMIIQDELHLLSGPLGTTVAVFDAVIQELLTLGGSAPKIVASTATIRASEEQVRGLYGRPVALYPPSGLDDDSTFFSRPVQSGEGRLYVGLMPQSLSQASALISASAPLLELPELLEGGGADAASRDAYWTLVMYHNSLRELGRSGTLVLDDVNGRLETRAERLGLSERQVRTANLIELTSRKGPDELPEDLRALNRNVGDDAGAVDVVLSSNMLSVGIDVPRLALMLMVGQPKTTAEYIQATSRVGRGHTKGLVVTLFRPNRARDRSHFETFRGYHEALYRGVEPSSVTPWSLSSRDRSLAGALVALVRQTLSDLAGPADAIKMDLVDAHLRSHLESLVTALAERVEAADPDETADTAAELERLLKDWSWRAQQLRGQGGSLSYERPKDGEGLLKRFGQPGEGWLVGDSMRSVEPNVAVRVREPQSGGLDGTAAS